jgi:hypothetical protein
VRQTREHPGRFPGLPSPVGSVRSCTPRTTQLPPAHAFVAVGAPAVGGLLAGTFGTGLPLVVDAATFVVVTVAAALVRTRRTPAGLGPDGRPAVARGGFEIVCADPVLAPLIIGLVVLVLLLGMVDVVLVFLIRATQNGASACSTDVRRGDGAWQPHQHRYRERSRGGYGL